MLYTIEIFPNGIERVATSTFFVVNDYSSWRTLVQEELRFFYAKDMRVDIEKVLTIVLNMVEIDIPSLYQIEMFGATFICLATEQLTAEQFQAFARRHKKDIMLRMERGLVDDFSVFFHWLSFHQFKMKSFHHLIEAFHRSDYSFFQKESTASLKSLIGEMLEDMEVLMLDGHIRDERWFERMEQVQKKYKPVSNMIDWLLPCDKESFYKHRSYLKKEYTFMLISRRMQLVDA